MKPSSILPTAQQIPAIEPSSWALGKSLRTHEWKKIYLSIILPCFPSPKQCHAYHPPVITIFIGGINHSQNGWFLALYYPNALFLRTSPNQFVAPKLPLYQVLSNPDIRKIATKCSERPNVCFGSRGWVEQKKK